MQITFDIKDQSIIKALKEEFHTDDVTVALDRLLHRFKYNNEYRMAKEIAGALQEVKEGKTEDVQALLDEL